MTQKLAFLLEKPEQRIVFHVGDIAGYLHPSGYRFIKTDKRLRAAHRLVILYTDGYLPEEVHHLNHVRDDNRRCNLLPTIRKNNAKSRLPNKNNTSGFKGVGWHQKRKKWVAKIRVDGKLIFLGYFDIAEEAYVTYCAAAKKYFGEFAY